MLITLEGIDGSGKSTQIRLLQEFIAQSKPEEIDQYLFTKNPGGTSLGKKIRKLLLEDQEVQIGSRAELFLYLSDRSEHFEQVIEAALKSNQTVICDRFIDSTVAYQSIDLGISKDLIKQLNSIATKNKKPDLTFLFDLEPEVALGRVLKDRKTTDKIEARGLDFMREVRSNFLELSKQEPERFILIELKEKSVEQIHQIITRKLFDSGAS